MSQEGKGYDFGQDYVTRAETLVHFYLHRREQAKLQCQGAHQQWDKCPSPAKRRGGGGCSKRTTSRASLTLSFSVARISSLLKKETEGSECQRAKATLQPTAGAAPASLGAGQDSLDTCPVLETELLPGQPAVLSRKAFLPP